MHRSAYELGAHPRVEDHAAIDVYSDRDADEAEEQRRQFYEGFIDSDSDSDYVYREYHEREVSLPKRPYWFGPPREIAATLTCQICLDDVDLQDTVKLSACGHRFCRGCFEQFLTLKIEDGQVNNLTCFHDDGEDASECGVPIASADIQEIVSTETFTKFERFQFNQSNSFARQCPHCEFSQLCEGPEQPQCVCVSCEKPFCFTHGNAHDAAATCAQYDKTQLRADRRNQRKIRRISKPCPSCKTAVEKNGGCNHMTCLTCSADFCWVCGQKLSAIITDHYDWRNIQGCAGQQMVEIDGLTSTNVAIQWLSRSVFYLIVYPVAFVLTLIAMVCSGFFVWCIVRREASFVQVFRWLFRVLAIAGYTALEASPMALAVGLCVLIYGIGWCCYAPFKYGNKLIQRCWACTCLRTRAEPLDEPDAGYEMRECGQPPGERGTDRLSGRPTASYFGLYDDGRDPDVISPSTQHVPQLDDVGASADSSEQSKDSSRSTPAARVAYVL